MKKTCLAVLGLLLLAAPLAMQAQFTYITNSDNTLTITGYSGPGGNVDIPGTFGDQTVTDIGTNAFASNSVTGITMPSTILNIEDMAFSGCVSLTNIVLSPNVTNIAYAAFAACSSLTNFTIPGAVSNIGDFAFILCGSLSSITVPASVASIGEAAFQNCTNMTNATLTQGLASIGGDAFLSCPRLAGITVPGSVTNIGEGAFQDCTGLATATISNGVTSIGTEMFQSCQSLRHVTLPFTVTNIGDYAFAGTILTGVRIPRSVTVIGDGAFSGTSLTNVTISSNVTAIGQNAFSICAELTNITVSAQNLFYSSLNDVLFDLNQDTLVQYPAGMAGTTAYTIPDSVNNIANGAFAGCSLATITVPPTVTNIGASAFFDCTNLEIAFFDGNAPTTDPSAFDFDNNVTIYYLPGTTGWSSPFAGVPALLWDPVMQASGPNFGMRSNKFGFNITGASGLVVIVEASTNLASPVWLPLQTVTLTNGLYYFSESEPTNASARYYRLSAP